MLRTCVEQAEQGGKAESTTAERLTAMKDFFETMSAWYDQVDQLPTSGILKFVRAGERLRKLFGAGG
jgi:site-specific recombinase XerC